jgi:transcription antitermination factor NusG
MAGLSENSAFHETVGDSLRQPLAGGVPERKWFVALVRSNYEEICRKKLQENGYEAYVACQKELHVYPNRHRREITHIIIPGLVFIRINEQERIQILKNFPVIKCFLTDKAGQANSFGKHPFAVVPDNQMERLQFMLFHADSPVNFTTETLHLGDHIRVVRGQLAGLEGRVTHHGNASYLVVALDLLGSAIVQIAPENLEKIA